ncbi:hypothetical protein AB6A40_009341 [Gnathostoma spinigerum]|uniref:Uncharacterized protein n=1 Tax=Gnathostoma spinigerum TaxID=75299 RepID=A0ABD6EU39_9BILA
MKAKTGQNKFDDEDDEDDTDVGEDNEESEDEEDWLGKDNDAEDYDDDDDIGMESDMSNDDNAFLPKQDTDDEFDGDYAKRMGYEEDAAVSADRIHEMIEDEIEASSKKRKRAPIRPRGSKKRRRR